MEEDEVLRNVIQVDVLKCRETGITGTVGQLLYDKEQGILTDFSQGYEMYLSDLASKSNDVSPEEKERALNRFN